MAVVPEGARRDHDAERAELPEGGSGTRGHRLADDRRPLLGDDRLQHFDEACEAPGDLVGQLLG